jgi:soluble P-type ATPase
MRTHPLLTSCLVLLLVNGYAFAQSFLIRTKEFPDQGKSIDVIQSDSIKVETALSSGGKLLELERNVEIEELRYIDKTLEASQDKHRPTKYSRTFTKAIKGPKDLAPLEQSYSGKTIIFELKDGKYKVMAEGGGVSDKDLSDLSNQANKPRACGFPENPIKVGETWKVSEKGVKAMFEDVPDKTVDLREFAVTGTLVKAYKKSDHQWGIVELMVKGPVRKLGTLAFEKPIELQMKLTLETAIDGSSTEGEIKSDILFKGRTEARRNGMTLLLDVESHAESRQVKSAEK